MTNQRIMATDPFLSSTRLLPRSSGSLSFSPFICAFFFLLFSFFHSHIPFLTSYTPHPNSYCTRPIQYPLRHGNGRLLCCAVRRGPANTTNNIQLAQGPSSIHGKDEEGDTRMPHQSILFFIFFGKLTFVILTYLGNSGVLWAWESPLEPCSASPTCTLACKPAGSA